MHVHIQNDWLINIIWLVVEPTHLKNMIVKLNIIFPKNSGWKFQKYLKLPPLVTRY